MSSSFDHEMIALNFFFLSSRLCLSVNFQHLGLRRASTKMQAYSWTRIHKPAKIEYSSEIAGSSVELYTPARINRQMQYVDGEWIAHFKGHTLRSVFQPIWYKSLSGVYGYEGLVRITRNGLAISPIDFFGSFTVETELTNVGLLCGCLHIRNFSQANLPGKIFINTHPNMFSLIASGEFPLKRVLERISRERVSLEHVVWEITEFKESSTELFTSGIATLRKTGTKVAVDDYGRQESNEYRVDLLNPDIVKIDRSLIHEHCKKPNSFLPELVERLSSRGYMIVLEGIENSSEHKALQSMCHSLVQGYHFGCPADIKKLSSQGNAVPTV